MRAAEGAGRPQLRPGGQGRGGQAAPARAAALFVTGPGTTFGNSQNSRTSRRHSFGSNGLGASLVA